jgi:hypothetical protein
MAKLSSESQITSFMFGLVSNKEKEKLNIFQLGEIFLKAREKFDLKNMIISMRK